MQKILEMVQAAVFIFFGVCFLLKWRLFANLIIDQNVSEYLKHKEKLRFFFYLISIIFLVGGFWILFKNIGTQ